MAPEECIHAGRALFERGVRQGAVLRDLPQHVVESWRDCFVARSYRGARLSKQFSSGRLLVVTSQDCDITANDEATEPCVELCVFDEIADGKVVPANQFVQSTRQLQVRHGDQWYQGRTLRLLSVEKSALLEALQANPCIRVERLEEPFSRRIPKWRALKYERAALPDAFSVVFTSAFRAREAALAQASSMTFRCPWDPGAIPWAKYV